METGACNIPFVCSRTDSENVTTRIDLTGVDIRMQLKKTINDSAIETFTIGDGITINAPDEGGFHVDEFINLKSYDYLHDILFTFPNGMVYTSLKGDYDLYFESGGFITTKRIHLFFNKKKINTKSKSKSKNNGSRSL